MLIGEYNTLQGRVHFMVLRGVMPPLKKSWPQELNSPPPQQNQIVAPPPSTALELCEFSHLKLLFVYNICFIKLFHKILFDGYEPDL